MNTNATTYLISIQLSTLDYFMATCEHVIYLFNRNIKVLLDSFKARGETTNQLPNNIFKGYTACSNKVFVKYIARNQEG